MGHLKGCLMDFRAQAYFEHRRPPHTLPSRPSSRSQNPVPKWILAVRVKAAV